jgi:hypothetical protein
VDGRTDAVLVDHHVQVFGVPPGGEDLARDPERLPAVKRAGAFVRHHVGMVWSMAIRGLRPVAALGLAGALAGCGSSGHTRARNEVTLPAYGGFPATTISAQAAGSRVCENNARTFAHDALGLLAHFGPAAAYPADLNVVIVREDLARWRTHGCSLQVLGAALARRLTKAQRRDLVDDLPASMASVVRRSLAAAGA